MNSQTRRRRMSGTYLTSALVGWAVGLAIWKGTEWLVLGIIQATDYLLGR